MSGESLKRIALGETMPIVVTQVLPVEGKDKFLVKFVDDDGDEGSVFLDVQVPTGPAELRIIHMDKPAKEE